MSNAIGEMTGANDAKRRAEAEAVKQAEQIAASAAVASKNTQEAAAQSARSMQAQATRFAAEGAASDLLDKPMENPDIQISAPADGGTSAAAKKRRQTFGTGSSSGVNI